MANTKKTSKKEQKGNKELVGTSNTKISTRGRVFTGIEKKKSPTSVEINFERTLFIQKFERFYKKKTRIHARLPSNIDVSDGDQINVRECRPLSKIIHAIVIEKVKSVNDSENKESKK